MGNGPEVVLSFFAAALAGTAAPLNPKYTPDEFRFYYDERSGSPVHSVTSGS